VFGCTDCSRRQSGMSCSSLQIGACRMRHWLSCKSCRWQLSCDSCRWLVAMAVTVAVAVALAVAMAAAPVVCRGMVAMVSRRRMVSPAAATVVSWLFELLSVRTDACGDLSKDLLKSDLVSWEPLHIVEGLDIH